MRTATACARPSLGRPRTFEADPRFGLVVLSDIVSKALSPGIKDPDTAIDVIAAAVRLLCKWSEAADRALPEVRHPHLRVIPVSPDEFLADALRQVARQGAGHEIVPGLVGREDRLLALLLAELGHEGQPGHLLGL